jgi:hypothetical protein
MCFVRANINEQRHLQTCTLAATWAHAISPGSRQQQKKRQMLRAVCKIGVYLMNFYKPDMFLEAVSLRQRVSHLLVRNAWPYLLNNLLRG